MKLNNSLLFGSRGERINEIQNIVEVVMRDGSVEQMAVPDFAAKVAQEPGGGDFGSLLGRGFTPSADLTD